MLKITGARAFSAYFSVIYITVFDAILLNGFGLMLQDWQPMLTWLHKVFVFPFYFLSVPIIFYLNLGMVKPIDTLSKDRKRDVFYLPISLWRAF